ncbi:MAG: carboxy terminal-processing peptidase [Chloroherpetonaceae bacterium]|nr:carboxy terminal-processing peptidase [Chloroherpetonaceae bacterium]MDW8438668.1 carboxy terminal-processing peptidase [Chloroherpetonaceae bacterium]
MRHASRLTFALVFALLAFSMRLSAQAYQPTLKHKILAAKIASILSQNHYEKPELDDSLSAEMFERYLDALDYNRIYFLQSDIQNFSIYRYSFDDDMKVGNLTGCYELFSVFKERFDERYAYVRQCLAQGFDFSANETFNADLRAQPWASDRAELDDRWRKLLKNQALELKLAGKSDSAIAATIQSRYDVQKRNLDKYNSDDVFSLYVNAFCAAIDPHTNYLAPANADNFKIEMNLSLEGIGARLQTENEYTKVFEIVPGGPAHKSKQLHKDDKIIAVAQGDTGAFVDVVGWRIDDVVRLIRGPKGTVVRLSVIPASEGVNSPPKIIRLVREKVNLEEQAAKKKVLSFKQNGKLYKIGVISIPNFYMNFEEYQRGNPNYRSTTRDVKKLIGELQQEKIDGLIIDLRNNGGGALPEAVGLTGLFVPSGPAVQVRNLDGSIEIMKDEDGETFYSGALGIMVNRFSASASEIFAGAIQDYKRGVIIGERTFGKGTVQNLTSLNRYVPLKEPLGDLKFTVAKFYRITGSSTQLRGVSPDIAFPSLYRDGEVGEDAEPNAMAWDEIAPASFSRYGSVTPKLIAELQKKHEARMKSNEELREYVKDIEELKQRRANKIISLNEAIRKAERDELEKKRLAKQKKPDAKSKDEISEDDDAPSPSPNDAALNEAARIVADMIGVS